MNELIFLQNFLDNIVNNNLDFNFTNNNFNSNDYLQKSQLVIEKFPQKSVGFFALAILYKHLKKYDLSVVNACAAILFADDFLHKNKEKLFNLLTFLDSLAAINNNDIQNIQLKNYLIKFLQVLYNENNSNGKFSYFSLDKLFNQDNLYKLHGFVAFMYNQISDVNKVKKHADLAISYDKFDGYHKSLMLALNSNMSYALGDLIAAENYAKQAIKLNPKGDGFLLLGIALNAQGKRFEAVQMLSKACEIQPNNHQNWERLAWAMLNIGEAEMAYNIADVAIEIAEKNYTLSNPQAIINSKSLHLLIDIFCKNISIYKLGNFAKQYADLVNKYNPPKFIHNKHYLLQNTIIQNNNNNNNIITKLNIGFVSGDLRYHPVSFFLLDILKNISSVSSKNNLQLNIFLFSTNNPNSDDNITAEFKTICGENNFFHLYSLSDDYAASLIQQHNIHILFDLSGYTINHRLNVFMQKPAPIQISWIGWVATTALPTMDYFFADKFSLPEHLQHQFTEKIYYLPNIWECYTPSTEILQTKITNNNNHQFITFGSFNDPKKVSEHTIYLWSEILKKLPAENSKLIWTRQSLNEVDLQQKFISKFLQHGIKSQQIEFRSIKSYADYLEKYNDIDLILDTFPVSGMTTTAEALLMGVPTLTLLGKTMASRLSGACINAVGDLGFSKMLICESESEFIKRAIEFFGHPEKLWKLKDNLRQKTINSSLCNTKLFTENFVIAIKNIWHNYLYE